MVQAGINQKNSKYWYTFQGGSPIEEYFTTEVVLTIDTYYKFYYKTLQDYTITEIDHISQSDNFNCNLVINVIPEPATICLLGLGGLSLLRKRRA
jgi:hypothetical protein